MRIGGKPQNFGLKQLHQEINHYKKQKCLGINDGKLEQEIKYRNNNGKQAQTVEHYGII